MSASEVRSAVESAFRDYFVAGVPSSGEREPDKAEVRYALGELLEDTLAAIGTGMQKFATTALRDAAPPTAGALAYVYKNNGSPSDPANGYYQGTGAIWEDAEWLNAFFALDDVQRARIDWAFVDVDDVSWTSISEVVAATAVTPVLRDDASGFTGFGLVFETPVAIEFNAVTIGYVPRAQSVVNKWTKIRVAVRSHATNPAAAMDPLAIGEIEVNPDQAPLTDLVVPLVDPDTGAPVTLDQTDLLARFGVVFQAFNAAGVATAGETVGGTLTGATLVGSWYTTAQIAETDAWFPYGGNPVFPIGVAMAAGLEQVDGVQESAALRLQNSDPPYPGELRNPRPAEIIMPPRWFGMQGYTGSIFNHGLQSGLGPRLFDYSGGTGLGSQFSDRWSWLSSLGITANGDDLNIATLHPDTLAAYDTAKVDIYVCAANAAASAARTLLVIGDSTTADGRATQQVLTRCAANAGGAQITLLGTQGAGANLHEGRSGWSMHRYFDPGAADYVANPFTRNDGDLFNYAHYMADYSVAAPDIAFLNLGINDVFGAVSDRAVNIIMDGFLDDADRIIGVTADAAVGSLKESNAAVKTIVALPISPGASQTGFGDDYQIGQSYARYKRNIAIAQYRIIEHYAGQEAAGIFLMPLHVTVDPYAGFDEDSDPIHPNSVGYAQIGDQIYFMVNNLIALGLA